jgi:NADH:ubiquinone oxidoreductase subunit F (NADH-binding)/(2Fe-2S) ferredoxin/Pyruvate/2-oxoacid:ferredoxin oxidoreductase delta subunit
MKLAGPAQLADYRARLQAAQRQERPCVTVCGGTGCRAYGAERVLAAARAATGDGPAAGVDVRMTGCHGFCEQGPIVVVQPAGIFYPHVQPHDVRAIVDDTAIGGRVIEALLYTDPVTGRRITTEHDVPFYARQQRLLLDLNGRLDPTSIDAYIALGGYAALTQALAMPGDEIVETIAHAGLRGRGGAGFPTGLKWRLARDEIARTGAGYVVCNADEGDPGAYMDRSLMEGNPHRVLEGLIIGAWAIGARRGYVYIRAEYPLAVRHLRGALEQARALGLLGTDILGSGFDFDVEIRLGAGAFVCGEETALIASIEGRSGDPRPRPPYPVNQGVWGRPTVINNVKTWASVPIILHMSAPAYAAIGAPQSKGTMIFSLVGKARNTGLVEVPMGTTLRELIFDIGGGVPTGKSFKAAQIGGPSGGCIPAEHLDTPIDYESLSALGAIMGSGGLVVVDEDTCMVDLARYFMKFVQEESCGKCVPCRVGTKAMLATLERITSGAGTPADVAYLEELAGVVKATSLCGLGQSAPNPVLTTLRYFRHEYDEHVEQGLCRAHVCKGLIRYVIDAERCTGCLICLRNCAANAISGARLQPHHIDPQLCLRCGVCQDLCKFDAVQVQSGRLELQAA